MDFPEDRSKNVPVQLPNGSIIKVEATASGREDVSFSAKEFQPIADAIEGIIQMIATPIQKAQPKKATVKFGMEIAVESGQLTAIILKGSGKANLEITLEW
jgi:Trypsin-co-occurring domain 1